MIILTDAIISQKLITDQCDSMIITIDIFHE